MVVKELLCSILCNLRLFVTLLKIKFEGEIFCVHTPFPLVGLAKSDSPLEQKRAWAHCVQNERDNGQHYNQLITQNIPEGNFDWGPLKRLHPKKGESPVTISVKIFSFGGPI